MLTSNIDQTPQTLQNTQQESRDSVRKSSHVAILSPIFANNTVTFEPSCYNITRKRCIGITTGAVICAIIATAIYLYFNVNDIQDLVNNFFRDKNNSIIFGCVAGGSILLGAVTYYLIKKHHHHNKNNQDMAIVSDDPNNKIISHEQQLVTQDYSNLHPTISRQQSYDTMPSTIGSNTEYNLHDIADNVDKNSILQWVRSTKPHNFTSQQNFTNNTQKNYYSGV